MWLEASRRRSRRPCDAAAGTDAHPLSQVTHLSHGPAGDQPPADPVSRRLDAPRAQSQPARCAWNPPNLLADPRGVEIQASRHWERRGGLPSPPPCSASVSLRERRIFPEQSTATLTSSATNSAGEVAGYGKVWRIGNTTGRPPRAEAARCLPQPAAGRAMPGRRGGLAPKVAGAGRFRRWRTSRERLSRVAALALRGGGSLAGARTGGVEGSPWWSRILRATGPCSITETARIRAAGAPSAGASPRFPADGPSSRPGVRTPPRRTAPRPGPRRARACRSLPTRAEARGARADPGPERPPGRRPVRPPPSSSAGPGGRPQRRRSRVSCRRPPGRGNGRILGHLHGLPRAAWHPRPVLNEAAAQAALKTT